MSPTVKRHRIKIIIFILVITVLAITSYSFVKARRIDRNKIWYVDALKYIKAYDSFRAKVSLDKSIVPEYAQMEHERIALLNSPTPDEAVLVRLLNSNDITDKKVGITLIKIKNLNSPELTKNILGIMNTEDAMYIDTFVYAYLRELDKSEVNKYEKELEKMLFWEQSKVYLTYALPLLAKMDNKKSIPYVSELFIGENSNSLRVLVYMIIKERNPELLQDLRKDLEKKHAADALDALNKLEAGKDILGEAKETEKDNFPVK